MSKRVKVPISSARAQLFQLADLVRHSRDNTVVVLEARGGVEPIALVREARLAYLEDRVAQMEATPAPAFTLTGSLATDLEPETLSAALLQLRQGWSPPEAEAPQRVNRPKRPAAPRRPRPR